MAISYGQFTGWVSVSYVLKSEPSCTSHKPRASYQRWQVHRGLVHGKCLHAATQSYVFYPSICIGGVEYLLYLKLSKIFYLGNRYIYTRKPKSKQHFFAFEDRQTDITYITTSYWASFASNNEGRAVIQILVHLQKDI